VEVAIVGGGPAGLYTGLLLGRDHPDWTVTVHERNPPGTAEGWGIVLPARTLGTLEAADAPTHAAIVDAAERWEPFDLVVDGRRHRSRGHGFASLLRTDLLDLLQDRCAEVGVDLAFERAVDDPRGLAAEADLLVGADGIASGVRDAYAEAFDPRLDGGPPWFSWFGTDAEFDALGHVFVGTDDGVWCAHVYPGPVSTFIVDGDAATWRASGFADASEAAIVDALERTFADALDGHGLRSQRNVWRPFTTVRTRSWHHDGVVLVGDAAHTAHYSIGSGTTMALEDAIALAGALGDDEPDLEVALAAYEAERRPAVASLQRAGERSRRHFANVRRFIGLEGDQFVLHHLTRTGRLTYASLARRDPDLVAAFDRWFATQAPGGPDDPDAVEDPWPPLAQPLALRGLRLPNRTVRVIEPTASAVDGTPSWTWPRVHPAAAAVGESNPSTSGVGLTLTEPLAVSAAGRRTPASPGLYDHDHEAAWRRRLEGRPGTAGAAGVHLTHAGRHSAGRPQPLAFDRPLPRNEAWAPDLVEGFRPRGAFERGALDDADRRRVEAAFVRATERADAAGFDLLQLDLGSDTLLGVRLAAATTPGPDDDGSFDDRARFALGVVESVRDAWPSRKPLGVTLQVAVGADGDGADHGCDERPDALGLEAAIDAGAALVDRGVDLLAPTLTAVDDGGWGAPVYGVANVADHLRNALGVPTLAAVGATTADEVNTLVATGRADLVGVAKPMTAGAVVDR